MPRLRGVGSALITAAVALSDDEGFKGRLGLHSLPQADAFYRKIGMTDLGQDTAYQNLRYFEMTAEKKVERRHWIIGKERMVKVRHSEGVATRIGPKPCIAP